jgi:anti-sigma B factor antagonist
MKMKSLHQDEVPVLEIAGRLDGAADNLALVSAVREFARAGETEVVIDLSRVRMITSTGLGLLMRARNRLERADGRLHLCELTPRSQELLYVTQTRPLFAVHETRQEAVEGIRGL